MANMNGEYKQEKHSFGTHARVVSGALPDDPGQREAIKDQFKNLNPPEWVVEDAEVLRDRSCGVQDAGDQLRRIWRDDGEGEEAEREDTFHAPVTTPIDPERAPEEMRQRLNEWLEEEADLAKKSVDEPVEFDMFTLELRVLSDTDIASMMIFARFSTVE